MYLAYPKIAFAQLDPWEGRGKQDENEHFASCSCRQITIL